jgi:hypothetical protein
MVVKPSSPEEAGTTKVGEGQDVKMGAGSLAKSSARLGTDLKQGGSAY